MSAPSEDPDAPGETSLEGRLDPAVHRAAEHAFRDLYRDLVPRLAAYLILGLGASRREAAECAHEALAQYWRLQDRVHNPSAWCRRAARSTFYKRMYDALDSFADYPATGEPLYAADSANLEDDMKRRSSLLALLTRLPPQQREVTALILDGLDYREIAAELHLEEATVRSHSVRARVRLAGLYREIRRNPEVNQ